MNVLAFCHSLDSRVGLVPEFRRSLLLLRLGLLPHDAGLSAQRAILRRADLDDFMSREVWLMHFAKFNFGAVRVGAGGEKG